MNKTANVAGERVARVSKARALIVGFVRDLLRAPTDKADPEIDRVLASLGDYSAVDRVWLVRLEQGARLVLANEWVATDVPSSRSEWEGDDAALIEACRSQFLRDEPEWIADVQAIPESDPRHAILSRFAIRSRLCVPILRNGELVALLGYDSVSRPRAFLETEVLVLRSAADVIGAVLHRRDDALAMAASERSLRDAGRKLKYTLSALPDLVLHVDADGRFIDGFTSRPELLLAPLESISGRLLEEILPPEIALRDRELMARARCTGQPARRRYRSFYHAAEWIELTVAVRPSEVPTEPPGYVFVVRDVTQEQHQRQTVERLGELSRRTVNLMVATNADGLIDWVNPGFEQITGYTLAEVKGRKPGEVLQCPESDPATIARMRAAVAAGQPFVEQILNVSKSGKRYWVRIEAEPQIDESGRVTGFLSVQTDVTDALTQQAKLERLAREAEEARQRLVNAVGALPDAFAYYDSDDRLVLCNDRYRAFYPLSAEMMIPGVRYEDILRHSVRNGEHRAAAGREEAWIAEQIAARAGDYSEREQNLSDGRWLRVIDMATPDGGRVGLRSDITELKRAETRLANIILAADVGTWEWDIAADNSVVNPRWAELLGYTLEEMTPCSHARFASLLHPEDVAAVDRAIDRVLRREVEHYEAEIRLRHKAGHWVWMLTRGRVLRWDEAGKPLVMAGVHLDITERKRLLAELREERDYLARLMDTSISGIVVMDEDRRITFMNAEAERRIGIAGPEIIGKPFSAMDWSPQELDGSPFLPERSPFAQVMRTGGPVKDIRFTAVRPDGERRVFSINAAPVKAEGRGLRVVTAIADVTDQVAADVALRAALDRAEAANRAKSQFVANMSHEIRTPLNGVLGMAELLAQDLTDPEHRRMIGVIRESGESLLGILNDILDMSKIEAGKMDVEALPFLPSELARKVEALHAYRAEEKGIAFSVLMDVGASRPRLGDPQRLLQILHNLVGNAMKFTDSGEVAVSLSGKSGDTFVIEVRDSGIGMSPEQIARVFEDFEQADGTVTRRFGGTGLGLAIVRRLVILMGGQITVQSIPQKGTTIRVDLPLPQAGAVDIPRAPGQQRPLAGLRVLVADDNATSRAILEAMLSGLDVEVTLVVNGRAALDAWEPGRFDVLLLDISMPEMDGITALSRIRARAAAAGCEMTPAIAITANAMAHQVQEYLAAGFNGHVAKPFRKQDVVDAVQPFAPCRRGLLAFSGPVP